MSTQLQFRRGTAASWTSANPTLAQGEIGWESDTNKLKFGDGATAWTSLPYFNTGQVPQTLFKIGIPFILPGAMTMGNNGAISAVVGLNTTYANCYMWFPTNTISAATPAGWYFVQMSSATAGTVFNNTYSSGTPTIPGSPTAFSTTAGTFTQTFGSDIDAITLSIPGAAIDANGQINVSAMWANSGVATNKINKVRYGGTTFYNATQTTSKNIPIDRNICNRGVTGSQVSESLASAGIAANAGAPIYLSIDTTTAQNLIFSLQLQANTDSAVLEYVEINVS